MNAIELLKSQHQEVMGLFDQIEESESEEECLALFEQIADALAAHTTIEEKIFYPAIYAGDLKDKLDEAVEEHLAAKRTIADLLNMPPNDDQFDAKIKVLREQIEHHVEEEENEVFPRVKASFEDVELEEYGTQMREMFDDLMTQEPRKNVPNEVAEAASPPR